MNAACGDSFKNGDETDVDCGGNCGATCAVGKVCNADADCASAACVSRQCTTCKPGAKQCTGASVQTCSAVGTWDTAVACTVANGTPSCNGGVCGIASCNSGRGNCDNNVGTGCETNLNAPATCGSTCASRVACASPTPACSGGVCVSPSCDGLASNCGSSVNESCCASPLVTGGAFYRSYDGVSTGFTSLAYRATVRDFRLDKYEVTVGRFRKFKVAWDAGWRPAAGAGKHTHLNGGSGLTNSAASGHEPGWNAAWTSKVTPTDAKLTCPGPTWTSAPAGNENRPMLCMNWYEAYAFCIWDGGFLPSEAEWNYAAAGGGEQRVYPWSSPPNSTAIDCSRASYSLCGAAYDNVGLKPAGNGKFGQADLAGNAWEYTLDAYVSPYTNSCDDCSHLPSSVSLRAVRSAFNGSVVQVLLASYRIGLGPDERDVQTEAYPGFRCARTP